MTMRHIQRQRKAPSELAGGQDHRGVVPFAVNNRAVLAVIAVPDDTALAVLQVAEGGSHNTNVVRMDEFQFVHALSQDFRSTPSKESLGIAHPFCDPMFRVPFDDGQWGVLDQSGKALRSFVQLDGLGTSWRRFGRERRDGMFTRSELRQPSHHTRKVHNVIVDQTSYPTNRTC